MVYVAITVAAMSIVVMCCVWALARSAAIKRWRRGRRDYSSVDEAEEEIQLNSTRRTFVLGDDDDDTDNYEHNDIKRNDGSDIGDGDVGEESATFDSSVDTTHMAPVEAV